MQLDSMLNKRTMHCLITLKLSFASRCILPRRGERMPCFAPPAVSVVSHSDHRCNTDMLYERATGRCTHAWTRQTVAIPCSGSRSHAPAMLGFALTTVYHNLQKQGDGEQPSEAGTPLPCPSHRSLTQVLHRQPVCVQGGISRYISKNMVQFNSASFKRCSEPVSITCTCCSTRAQRSSHPPLALFLRLNCSALSTSSSTFFPTAVLDRVATPTTCESIPCKLISISIRSNASSQASNAASNAPASVQGCYYMLQSSHSQRTNTARGVPHQPLHRAPSQPLHEHKRPAWLQHPRNFTNKLLQV